MICGTVNARLEAVIRLRVLAGHALRVAVVPGGAVEIEPLP